MLTACLAQPRPEGRLSGGYLYNARMAEHGAFELRDASAETLEAVLREAARSHRLVLCDSLWLAPETIETLIALRAEGLRLGLVLHTLPSQLASRSWPAALELTADERRALSALAPIVLPGPFYVPLLERLAIAHVLAPPGVEPSFRARPRPLSAPARLLSLGAVAAHKGFADVLEILRASQRTDVHYAIIGELESDPAYVARVRALATALPNVSLLGQRSPDEARSALQAADVLLVPSYVENHPLVVLEALCASVPVVGYAAGGMAAMIEHGTHGLLASVGDRSTLATNLTRLLDDPALHARMATACHERQRTLPTWNQAATTLKLALTQTAPTQE